MGALGGAHGSTGPGSSATRGDPGIFADGRRRSFHVNIKMLLEKPDVQALLARLRQTDRRMAAVALLGLALGLSLGLGLANYSDEPSAERPPVAADAAGAVLAAAGGEATQLYVCPMHPEIVSDHPGGKCPICGMDLVAAASGATGSTHEHVHGQADEHAAEGGAAGPAVRIEPSVRNNLGIRVATVVQGTLTRRIQTIGKITRVDPTARRIITPPIYGELLSIAEKYDGDRVEAGDLLFSVGSPELYDQQRQFKEAIQAGDRVAANSLIPGLREMGMTPEQIVTLQTGQGENLPVEVRAAEGGFVFARRGEVGDAVNPGITVFNLGGNYRVVEVTAEIFERQWGWVQEGQQATMQVRGVPGVVFTGTVSRVEPPVGYTTRSLEVRLRFESEHAGLSQSMFAHVEIAGQPRSNVLLAPAESVIRTGLGDRVVVRGEDGVFVPKTVEIGEEADGHVEILSGLSAGEQVVVSGQFLLDSESNRLAALGRMRSGGSPGAAPRSKDPGREAEEKRIGMIDGN